MGTVYDDAHAKTSEFGRTLAALLDQERYDSSFFSVLWDPLISLTLHSVIFVRARVAHLRDL